MRRTSLALLTAALIPLGVPAAAAGQATDIQIVGFKFVPPVATAQRGDTVRWTNTEPVPIPHNVVQLAYAPPGGTPTPATANLCGALTPGQQCARKDLKPGTYVYTCTINAAHTATMQGVLVVQ